MRAVQSNNLICYLEYINTSDKRVLEMHNCSHFIYNGLKSTAAKTAVQNGCLLVHETLTNISGHVRACYKSIY